MGIEAFRYDGKRALVVGGATGMGAATARLLKDLGADLVVMDYAPVDLPGAQTIQVDLRDKDSIDAAVDACGGPVHALVSCAGVADGTPGIEKVNFIGARHLIERFVNEDKMPRGSAVAMISSGAGMGWEQELDLIMDFLSASDFEAASKWMQERPERANYLFTKQVILAYVAWRAYPFLKKGVRINATMPGPTDTPLAQANAELWLAFGADYRDDLGLEPSTPEEQAYPLAFLCSAAASHINGICFDVDAGYRGAGFTGAFDAPLVKALLGKG